MLGGQFVGVVFCLLDVIGSGGYTCQERCGTDAPGHCRPLCVTTTHQHWVQTKKVARRP